MSQFTRALVVSPLSDGRTWVLMETFGYDVGVENSGDTIRVPARFMTDFASVPRPFWSLFPQWGRYGNAAVVHDFLYWEQCRSRKEADRIFLEAMGVLGVPAFTRYTLYLTVRCFGFMAWWADRRRRETGTSMVAARPPERSVESRDDVRQAAVIG